MSKMKHATVRRRAAQKKDMEKSIENFILSNKDLTITHYAAMLRDTGILRSSMSTPYAEKTVRNVVASSKNGKVKDAVALGRRGSLPRWASIRNERVDAEKSANGIRAIMNPSNDETLDSVIDPDVSRLTIGHRPVNETRGMILRDIRNINVENMSKRLVEKTRKKIALELAKRLTAA